MLDEPTIKQRFHASDFDVRSWTLSVERFLLRVSASGADIRDPTPREYFHAESMFPADTRATRSLAGSTRTRSSPAYSSYPRTRLRLPAENSPVQTHPDE